MKKFFFILLLTILLIGSERLFYYLTEGFGYPNVDLSLSNHDQWYHPMSKEEVEEIKQALNQEYTYFSKGCQSFVFLSEDQSYVLKFFKNKKWRLNPIFNSIPLPKFLEYKRNKSKIKKKEVYYSTLNSCSTAFNKFKNETALLYVHLNKTKDFNQSLIVKDKLNCKHYFDLDDTCFILQRKAIQTDEYLLKLKDKGQTQKAKNAIYSLFKFNIERARKGYSDKDPHPINNFGFIGNKVVEIDIGGFHQDPKKDLTYFYKYEINRIQKKLMLWLKKYYPELSSHAMEIFQEIIKKNCISTEQESAL